MPEVTGSSNAMRDPRYRWLRALARSVALAMAAVHTAAAVLQQSMNEDGISYLDMGDAYLDGNWAHAFNRIWSPIYGVLIAASVRIAAPAVEWEFPTVQLANFGIFVAALIAFEFFWTRLSSRYSGSANDGAVRFPPSLWIVLGYSLFIWSSLELISMWAVTPDLCVAAVVYLAAGCMLQRADEPARVRAFVVLGLLFGFGYLVKAALLPLGAIAVVLTAMAATGTAPERLRCAAAGLAAMLVVAAPLIGALSWSAGELTTGDVGRFAYLKHVNEMPYPDFHDAVDRLGGEPEHPPRRVFDNPPVYEFAQPVGGTYPMAYDPGYWTAGLEPIVSLSGQARALATSAMTYFDLFVRRQGPFLALVLMLGALCIRRPLKEWRLDGNAALLIWSLAAFGLYALVHVELRYVAPFVLLFWASLLARLRFPPSAVGNPAFAGAALLIAFLWINLGASNLDGLARLTGFTPLSENAAQPAIEESNGHSVDHPSVASALKRMGLDAGDAVGFIGYSYSEYWARLARLRIVAEIHWHEVPRFWNLDPEARATALDSFAASGAVAVLAAPGTAEDAANGWRAVGDTGYLLFPLRPRLAQRLVPDPIPQPRRQDEFLDSQ